MGRGTHLVCHDNNKIYIVEYPFYRKNQTLIILDIQDKYLSSKFHQVSCSSCLNRGFPDEKRYKLYPRISGTLKPGQTLPFKRKDGVENGRKLEWIKYSLL